MPITIASKLSLVVKKTIHLNHMDLNPTGILKENCKNFIKFLYFYSDISTGSERI